MYYWNVFTMSNKLKELDQEIDGKMKWGRMED